MDDPFFAGSTTKSKKQPAKGRGAAEARGPKKAGGKSASKKVLDEHIDDDLLESDSDAETNKRSFPEPEDEEEVETAAEKRLRLAKDLISRAEAHEREQQEAEEVTQEAIAHRLNTDLLEQKGHLRRQLADKLPELEATVVPRFFRAHKQPLTCLAVGHSGAALYTGGKDGSVVKWSVATGKKMIEFAGIRTAAPDHRPSGHLGHVYCIAVSTDEKFLATGGHDKYVFVWDLERAMLAKVFRGHGGAIHGLAFRRNSHQLFSASADRSVKIWNLDEMAYVETLFGHEDAVMGIAALDRERAVSVGGRDHSLRVWKVVEESQLVLQAPRGNIDCLAMITESNFVTGSDDGSISLWDVAKKKPVCSFRNAHGPDGWITALAAIPFADIVVSGSSDGFVRLWKLDNGYRNISTLMAFPVTGVINALAFSPDCQSLFVGASQEPRLGRWIRIKQGKSGVHVFTFPGLAERE
eukprot:m.28934 g.28934  ORF g.28934 m.28934 type:complete len:467 (+) comp9121_c1_seq2:2757-4157(+)